MHTSINSQFKQFGEVLAKQQTTFEEMQASTTAQFKQFYEILGLPQFSPSLLFLCPLLLSPSPLPSLPPLFPLPSPLPPLPSPSPPLPSPLPLSLPFNCSHPACYRPSKKNFLREGN